MIVLAIENAPPRLRGRLALWLTEVRSGVFVGVYSSKVRETIWAMVVQDISTGNAILISTAPTESGFSLLTAGEHRRTPIDTGDGLQLMQWSPSS